MKHILLLWLAGINLAISQTVMLTPFEATKPDPNTAHLKECSLLQLDVRNIQSVLNNTKGNIYKLNLRTPDRVFQLELYEYSMFAANHVRSTTDNKGNVIRLPKRNDLRTFSGILNGQNNSQVSMTIGDGYLRLIMNDKVDKYFLEQYGSNVNTLATPGPNKFILYKERDVLPIQNVKCGVNDLNAGLQQAKKQVEQVRNETRSAPPCKTCAEVQIAIGADASMFIKYGSIPAVDAYILSTLADVQTMYDDEFEWELMYALTGTWIADDPVTDPFGRMTDINTEFNLFRQLAPVLFAGADYDVATLWSSKFIAPNTVGLSDNPGVCATFKYNIVSSFIPNVNSHPAYATLQAHELGHNWTCIHDDISSNTIMNPLPTQATTWSSQSQRDLFTYVFFQGLIGTCLTICQGTGLPIPEFTSDITSGCQPVTVKFKDQSSLATSWKWKFPGGTPDTSILQNPTVVYRIAGKWPVTLEVANSRCSASIIKYDYIDINDVPDADFTYGIQGREIFFIDQSPRATEWHWKFGDGNESDEQFPFHMYDRDTSYEVTLYVQNECGRDSVKKRILVESIPIADFDSDRITGCAPQVVKYFDQSTNNVKTWQWEFTGGVPNVSTAKNPVVRYDLPGTYDVRLTVYATKFHSSITKTMYVTIDSIPIAKFSSAVDVGKVDFTNQSRYAKSHFWDFGDGATSTDSMPTHNYKEGIYKVIYIVFNSCGSDTAETTLTIGTKPVPGFQSNVVKGCIPMQVQFQNTSTDATSYKWYFPGGNPATSTDPNPLVSYNTTGLFNVSLVASNVFYSDSIGKPNFIEVKTAPNTQFTNVISGFKSTFTNNTTGANNYLWTFGNGKISFEKDPPPHDYGVEGEFTVRLIASNECGQDTFTKLVAIYLVPKVDFTVEKLVGCRPFQVQFLDKSSVDVIEWDWLFENGNPATSNQKNPVVVFDKVGKYTVKLTVKNTNGSNSRTRTQYIQVVSPVFCPESTRTPAFDLSDPFNRDLDERSETGSVDLPAVYPNPAQNYINVKTNANLEQPAIIEVFDLAGRKLTAIQSNQAEYRIRTDQWNPGTYYLKIKEGQSIKLKKFVLTE